MIIPTSFKNVSYFSRITLQRNISTYIYVNQRIDEIISKSVQQGRD